MLIVALVLAVVGLAALVTAVVTSNELVAWVCIGASALGVLLLTVDAIRERQQRRQDAAEPAPSAESDADQADNKVEAPPEAEAEAEAETPVQELEFPDEAPAAVDGESDQVAEVSTDRPAQ